MTSRIGTRLILGVALVTAVVIGLMSVVIVRAHRSDLVFELTRGAGQLSQTIASGLHDDMLANRRDSIHSRIQRIGGEQGIEKIRLFNKEGRITFSSDTSEIGRAVDKSAEACYACHAEGQPLERLEIPNRARIFRTSEHGRVLGIINPIFNEPSCWTAACHAHGSKEKVLGVLDVTVSLAEVDKGIVRSRLRMAGVAVLAILASSTLLWWLNRHLVVKPVAALVEGTRRVAGGELGTMIPVRAGHELADLARSFNEMMTRLSEAQRQLTQADKLASVGRLAAGVAHEINNPLTGVLTYASLLLKRAEETAGAGNDEQRADLEVIIRETKRCRDIVKGLLDFARQTAPNRRPTDLNEVVKRSAAIVINQLTLNRVSLSLDLAPDLPLVAADGNQIQQVVVNLLVNAADAIGGEGGAIRLATREAKASIDPAPGPLGAAEHSVPRLAGPAVEPERERDVGVSHAPPRRCVEILVEDDGRGIAPADLKRLFEPFFTTKGARGTGLGLAVTWGIVQGHGGTIDVWSEPDRGSRFTVRLPIHDGAAPDQDRVGSLSARRTAQASETKAGAAAISPVAAGIAGRLR